MTLLHLDASPRPRSLSRRLSATFAETWRALDPGGGYLRRDLAADPVPHIGAAWTELCDNLLAAGISALDRLHEGARTPAQRAAWAVVEPLLDEVVRADVILIGTPMYNYSVPSALKAWIDQITFPRMDLGGRRVVVTAARGGTYAPGTARSRVEHQTTYLTDVVQGHFALGPPVVITVELGNARVDPALATRLPDHERSLRAALDEARRAAVSLHGTLAGSGAPAERR